MKTKGSSRGTGTKELLDNGLTPLQYRFAIEYLKDQNGREAYIRAGYKSHGQTATGNAHRLLKNPKIQAVIMHEMNLRKKRTRIDADWVLKRLADEVDADLSELYNKDMTLKAVHEWPEIWRKGLVSGIDVEALNGEKGTITKIKLSDRLKRIELIGKHIDVKAFVERFENIETDTEQDLYDKLATILGGTDAEKALVRRLFGSDSSAPVH